MKSYCQVGAWLLGANSERFRLRNNGITFHELSYDDIRASCVGLTHVLLLRGLNTVIDWDHQHFWSWGAELLLARRSGYFSEEEYEIKNLFGTVVRASLAGIRSPNLDQEAWERWQQNRELMEFNTRMLEQESQLLLAYIVFPLLEAVLKKACQQYVDYTGQVLQDFQIPSKGGGNQRFRAGRQRCQDIRALLLLLCDRVAGPDLKSDLNEIREHLEDLAERGEDPFKLISEWRNTSLHGQTTYPTIGGTLLNLIFLISLASIREQYEQLRAETINEVQRNLRIYELTGSRSPWAYYPPYVQGETRRSF
jgi:hypothetical protein